MDRTVFQRPGRAGRGSVMAQNDAMLLGRVTYEGFAAAFGGQSGGMADQMNSTPKYVVSSTLASTGWQNSTLISGDVAGRITELKQRPGEWHRHERQLRPGQLAAQHGLLDRLTCSSSPSCWAAASACSTSRTASCRSR